MQATHPGSGVKSSRAFEPAVDDGGNAIDREGGFGDVGRKNDSAIGPGDERGVLLSRRQAAVKGEHGRSVGAEGGGQFPFDRADLTDPGRKTSTSPGPRSASRTARTTAGARGSLRFLGRQTSSIG